MGNSLTNEVMIQVSDIGLAAKFYVEQLGFEISEETVDDDGNLDMVSLYGNDMNLYIAHGPQTGAVLEVLVEDVEAARDRILAEGGEIIRWDERGNFVRDPFGMAYHLRVLGT